jgi:2-oxoacid:acceptor oxidoreductase gamma subunit (pyruvate/2-ketoisovalerate family)
MNQNVIQIRWHGRGGQGAITAAKIIANTAFVSGYTGVVMAPTFGTERRGAPVLTSLKISRDKIYDLSPITEPDIVVVLDHLLVEEANVASGLKPGGMMIINTSRKPSDYPFHGIRVAVADVTHIAAKAGLPPGIVNSGIIGAFARATQLLDIEDLAGAVEAEFIGKKPKRNARSARETYDQTIIGG